MQCKPGFRWDPTLNMCVSITGYVDSDESEPAVVEVSDDESQDQEPTDAQVRRMTKPDLVSYGQTLGLSLDEDEYSHDEMVDAVLEKRYR